MEDLIKALMIMLKHGDTYSPCNCSHDELHIYPNSMDFTDDEFSELERLGFYKDDDEGFCSFRFGSC